MSLLRLIQDNDAGLQQRLTDLNHPCYFEFAQLALQYRSASTAGDKAEMDRVRKLMVAATSKYDLSKAIVPIKSLVDRIAAGDNDVVDYMIVEIMYQTKVILDSAAEVPSDSEASVGLNEAMCNELTSHFYENFFLISPDSRKRFQNGHPGMFGLLMQNAINERELESGFLQHLKKVHAPMHVTKAEKDAFKAAFQMALNEERGMSKKMKSRLKGDIDTLIAAVFDAGNSKCRVS